MRVTKEKAAENRERILNEAARLFRENGSLAVGMDALANAAGMTHGSLYSHFRSKDALAAEALKHGAARNAAKMASEASAGEFLTRYLSSYHRDHPGNGCFMAALGCAIPGQSKSLRRTFTDIVQGNINRVRNYLSGRHASDDAIFFVSAMVGAMMLARSIEDTQLSERFLDVTKTRLRALAEKQPNE